MDGFIRDLRYGCRLLRRDWRLSLLAILTLTLGIGATTAVFTIVNAVLLRPLPYKDPARIVVALYGENGNGPVSPADFLDYARDARSFERLAAAQAWGVTIGGGERPERVDALTVSVGMFDLLGVQPALGRGFAPGEDEPGRDRVVLIGDALWHRRFGGDPGVVGRTIPLNGAPYVVIGVMPPGFQFAPFWVTRAEVWAPLVLAARAQDRDGQSLRMFGRLREATSIGQAQAEMNTIGARLARAYPATHADLRVRVQPLLAKVVAGIEPTLLMLMALVLCVMTMACVNVANALLARATRRRAEVALRLAIGAGRAGIVRQFVAESLILAAAGAIGGLVFAAWAVHALMAVLPAASLPRQHEVGFDSRVFALASAAALAAALVTGLAPALQFLRRDEAQALREDGRGAVGGGRERMRHGLVAVEIALALVLLVGAGLLGRTMSQLAAVDPGFRVDGLAVATVSLAGTPQGEPANRAAAFAVIRDALARLPHVTAVSAINHLPLAGDTWTLGYTIDGRPAPRPGQAPHAVYRVVQPGYFTAMGLRLVRGREIDARDTSSSLPVAVINDTMARRQFPGEDPVGRQLRLPGPGNFAGLVTIVGVSAAARQSDWTSPPDDEVYVALAQRSAEFGLSALTFVLRADGHAADAAAAVPRAVAAVDRGAAVSGSMTMAAVVADRLWRERLTSTLTTAFALVALGLAAIGVYAMVAFVVARRTREFGVRMALGATRGQVLRIAIAGVSAPVVWGTAAGLGAAVAGGRFMRALVFDVSVVDPIALGGAAIVLLGVAAGAAWLPARRASRLDPSRALRGD